MKRKQFIKKQYEEENEIENLKKAELEVKDRTHKTLSEKQSLENQTSDGNNKVLSEACYKRIKDAVTSIKTLVDRKQTQD